MKNTTIIELKKDIEKINNDLQNNVEKVQEILKNIENELKKLYPVIDRHSDLNYELYAYIRKNDDFNAKRLKAELNSIEDEFLKADAKKLLLQQTKNYYCKQQYTLLKKASYEILFLIEKYNINNNRDLNILKNMVAFSYDSKGERLYNTDLCFYSYIYFREYDQQIKTAYKSNRQYTNCDKNIDVSCYCVFTDSKGDFYNEPNKENIERLKQQYNNIDLTYCQDYIKIVKSIEKLQQLKQKQKNELNEFMNKQKQQYTSKNIFSLDDEVVKG